MHESWYEKVIKLAEIYIKSQERIANELECCKDELKRIADHFNPKPKKVVDIAVEFGAPVPNATQITKGDSPMNTSFNAPDADSVPYQIALTDPTTNAPYVLQSDDVVALESTDGHSTVTPNPADPTGETGSISDTAGFDGPVSGTATFTPGVAATAAGYVAASGTWSGQFNPTTKTLAVTVSFGTPIVASETPGV
jgi:hypothetical protein